MLEKLILCLSFLSDLSEQPSEATINLQKCAFTLPKYTVAYSTSVGVAISKSQHPDMLSIDHVATGVRHSFECPTIRRDLVRFLGSSHEFACFVANETKLVVVDSNTSGTLYEIFLPKELPSPTGFKVSHNGKTGIIWYRDKAVLVKFATRSTSEMPSFNLGGEISDVGFSPLADIVAFASVGTRGLAVVDIGNLDRLFDVEGFEVEYHVEPQTFKPYLRSTHCQCTDVQFSNSGNQIIGIVSRNGVSQLSALESSNGRVLSSWSKPNTRILSAHALPGLKECLVIARGNDSPETSVAILVDIANGTAIQQLLLPRGMKVIPEDSAACSSELLVIDTAGDTWNLLHVTPQPP